MELAAYIAKETEYLSRDAFLEIANGQQILYDFVFL